MNHGTFLLRPLLTCLVDPFIQAPPAHFLMSFRSIIPVFFTVSHLWPSSLEMSKTPLSIIPSSSRSGIRAMPKIGILLAIVVLASEKRSASAFGRMAFVSRRRERAFSLYSSTGDSLPPPPPEDDDEGDFGDFLNPKQESEQLRRAREYMSEQSLPLSFDADEEEDESTDDPGDDDESEPDESKNSSALVPGQASRGGPLLDGPSQEALAKNPYMQVVSKLSPSELISKFTATANPRVQDAVRNTVLGLIGSLPKMAFETTTITTGQRLASLMFQLQMTGYMFRRYEDVWGFNVDGILPPYFHPGFSLFSPRFCSQCRL